MSSLSLVYTGLNLLASTRFASIPSLVVVAVMVVVIWAGARIGVSG
jgi:hypothetical protein